MTRSLATVIGLAAAVGALAGCSSSSPSKPAGAGSSSGTSSTGRATSGGSASTTGTSGSTGGTSGASAGTSGSSGTTGGAPTCDFAQRWDGSACVAAPMAYVDVTQYAYFLADGGPDPRFSGSAVGYFLGYQDSGYPDYVPPPVSGCSFTLTDYFPDGGYVTVNLADGGPVTNAYGSNYALTWGSWGDLTVSGAQPGTLTLDQDGGRGILYPAGSAFGSVGDVFSGGETVSLNATGSAAFPAWSASLVAPPPLKLEPAPFVRGQPWTVSWTGSSAQPLSFSGLVLGTSPAGATEYWGFDCAGVPDTGSYTFAAGDTAHAPASAESGFVRGERWVSTSAAPTQSFVTEQLSLYWDAETEFVPH